MFGKFSKKWVWPVLVIPDLFFTFVALWLALFTRFNALPTEERFWLHIQVFIPMILVWLLVFFVHGLYEPKTFRRYSDVLFGTISAAAVCLVIAAVYFYIQPKSFLTPKRVLLIDIAYLWLLITLWRIWLRKILTVKFIQEVFLLDTKDDLKEIAQEINDHKYLGFSVVRVHSASEVDLKTIDDNAIVVVPDQIEAAPELLKNVYQLRKRGVSFVNPRDFYESVFRRIWLSDLTEIWFLENIDYQKKRLYNLVKRAIDIVFGLLTGLVFIITYPIFALLIKLSSPGKVIFTQERVGKNGSIFTVYKYRTMSGGPTDTWTLPNDPRITRVGNIFRKLRIDELPQCINLLKGDMSLVGPRPEQVHFVNKLRVEVPFFDERHLVKPGLTGWAQLNVYAGSLEETRLKLQYDLYYIKHRSVLFDLEIILKTLYYIFTWSGR